MIPIRHRLKSMVLHRAVLVHSHFSLMHDRDNHLNIHRIGYYSAYRRDEAYGVKCILVLLLVNNSFPLPAIEFLIRVMIIISTCVFLVPGILYRWCRAHAGRGVAARVPSTAAATPVSVWSLTIADTIAIPIPIPVTVPVPVPFSLPIAISIVRVTPMVRWW